MTDAVARMDDEERLRRLETATRRYLAKVDAKHTRMCATERDEPESCDCGLEDIERLLYGPEPKP